MSLDRAWKEECIHFLEKQKEYRQWGAGASLCMGGGCSGGAYSRDALDLFVCWRGSGAGPGTAPFSQRQPVCYYDVEARNFFVRDLARCGAVLPRVLPCVSVNHLSGRIRVYDDHGGVLADEVVLGSSVPCGTVSGYVSEAIEFLERGHSVLCASCECDISGYLSPRRCRELGVKHGGRSGHCELGGRAGPRSVESLCKVFCFYVLLGVVVFLTVYVYVFVSGAGYREFGECPWSTRGAAFRRPFHISWGV